ncbi:MAG TPA: TIGR03067 domain-containing protein [Gemmataceae bacterium]|jgi:uncharacterized protein (TIGR03067 family)
MRRCAWLAAALVLAAVAQADDKADAVKKELAKLEGSWKMVSMEIDGNKASEDDVAKIVLVLKGENYSVEGADQEFKGTLTFDPTKKPKTVERKETEGPGKGETGHGIYELEGDELKLCFAANGKDRPGKFTGEEGHQLFVFQRKK